MKKCIGRGWNSCCKRLKICPCPLAVYFIKPVGFDGPIKIGKTKDAEKRLRALSLVSPFPLEMMASIKGADNLEGRFHRKFLHLHTNGEWFEPAPELLATIAEIASGVFDIGSLPEKPAKHGDLYPRNGHLPTTT